MDHDIYRQLRTHVARHSAYFPASKTGVEMKFLKKLFTEGEACMYLALTPDLETVEEIAARSGHGSDEAARILAQMANKGLVFPKRTIGGYLFAAAPFAHGLVEHQAGRVDRELAELYEEYIWAEKVPEARRPEDINEPLVPLRSIPIDSPVRIDRPVAPYEDVRDIIMKQDRIALAPCFCAEQQRKLGSKCNHPLDVCLILGFYADYYIEQGFGRRISRDEALRVLDTAEESGLVHQIPNSIDPGAICNCCPDCCGGLRVLKKLPNPAHLITTNHYCSVDSGPCSGCGACIERCPMDAITIGPGGTAEINTGRCIGCGLCMASCADKALSLKSKPEEKRSDPPRTLKFMRSSADIEGAMKIK